MRQLYAKSRNLKRFLSVAIGKRRNSSGEDDDTEDKAFSVKQINEMEISHLRPSWRCFSYEEIVKATDGFHKGPKTTPAAAGNGACDVDRCLAPEYFMHGIVDEKTDVFAFGVFLLEIVTGRKPVDGCHRNLLCWINARSYLNDGIIDKLVDPRLGEEYDMGQLKRLTFAASLCTRPTATLRPSMTEVVELLEGGEITQEQWKMLEEEEEEFWGFDDLDDDDNRCSTPSTSSTGNSQAQFV
ncbi:hypothetical protein C4D60_Mb05t23840 [Musa balbisiana]|uniref:Serine-threonine/tyrosine-protein kinase catalytic domain-containing protein n=1 Tax=Musa balbisiana TaxID=52838 RepID=A0A4S8JYD3_MUSBA|nr:hypothetical protein C4D60_Mb05t23840 [Musa balbisiana]